MISSTKDTILLICEPVIQELHAHQGIQDHYGLC